MRILLATSIVLITALAGSARATQRPDNPVFVANEGSEPISVKFIGRLQNTVARFESDAMTISVPAGVLRIQFEGASLPSPPYLSGENLVYHDTWPQIETQYIPHKNTLKSEYHLDAGADPNLIHLRYSGTGPAKILPDGSLVISVPGGEFVESAPYAYQEQKGMLPVSAAWRIYDDGTVGFAVGPYDRSLPLVIDPVMNYSTFFGGHGDTSVTSVALDTYGNAVVAGWTSATDLPAHGARTKSGGGVDAFVAKLSAEGNQVIWCTYLGGIGDDRAFGVALDGSNNVYVTGWTQSSNFPVVGAIQSKLMGSRAAFVTKLNSMGTAIIYSTYLGGSTREQGNAITVDSSGAAYITGDSYSANFPVVNAYQSSSGGQQDVFVSKLNSAGNALVFSTYLGGTAADHGAAIALDASRNVYVTGSTYSSNFPVAAATQPRIGGGQDAFLAELSSAGSLIFGTFIGGSGGTPGLGESGNGVAVDSSGNVYVAGSTSSIDFPVSSGAYQSSVTNGGAEDHGFAWKLNSSKQVVYSTYISGMNVDVVTGLAVDTAGNAYLVGSTASTDFPGVRAFQSALMGLTNAFVLKLNPTGSGLIFGSFLGGSSSDTANCIAVDSKQNMVIGGLAQSSDFPLLNAAQSYSNGVSSGFITRVVSGWYPIAYSSGVWNLDVWHDAGYDGSAWTLTTASFGQTGDLPIFGDWTHSGVGRIGVFRNGTWFLDINGNGRFDSTDRQFTFGQAGDIPIVGDWDGTGSLKAGLFRKGLFILDLSGHLTGVPTGKPDVSFYFGTSGDIPVAGDWGSTGVTKIGVFRNGTWFLDVNNSHSWDSGDQSFVYGMTGDTPLVGDWDGSGTPKIGISRAGNWMLNITGNNQYRSGIDTQFFYGNSSFQFLVGR